MSSGGGQHGLASEAEGSEDSGLPELSIGPELFLNRELGWLAFDSRVLHEAEDPRNPLLERVKFLAISDSNLDEFVMKRIGGLKQQLGAGLLGGQGFLLISQAFDCQLPLAAGGVIDVRVAFPGHGSHRASVDIGSLR